VVPNEGDQGNPRGLKNPRSQRHAEHTEENRSKMLYNYTIVVIKFLTIN
jgi:hypothetical protein